MSPLRICRRERHLTQEAAAAAAGVSVPIISAVENGTYASQMHERIWRRLVKFYGADMQQHLPPFRPKKRRPRP